MYNHSYVEKVQQFTCRTYVATSSTAEANDLRCQLFCAKRGAIEYTLVPPCSYFSSGTSFEPTARQKSGSAVRMPVPQRPILPSVAGYMMMASLPFTGCGRHHHQMMYCNCWLTSESVTASCQNVRTWQID